MNISLWCLLLCFSSSLFLLLPRLLWPPRRGSVIQLLRKGKNSISRKTVLIPQEINIYGITDQMNCGTWRAARGKVPRKSLGKTEQLKIVGINSSSWHFTEEEGVKYKLTGSTERHIVAAKIKYIKNQVIFLLSSQYFLNIYTHIFITS